MRCEQASEMMSARLDSRLDRAQIALLDEHLAECSACQAEWQKLLALDLLFASAPMARAPVGFHLQVMTRLSRRDQARRAIFGGLTLMLGTVSLALLVLAPAILGLLDKTGIGPALLGGGPQTAIQLLTLLGTFGRTVFVMTEHFALPLLGLSLGSLMVALALNRLWIGAVRRLRAVS